MLHIGITGGIGSGKTTVCKIFETLGIPAYYADDRAKALMTNDLRLVATIKNTFGDEAYLPDGALNRSYLAATVFGNTEKLAQLNAIVHPAVIADGIAWQQAQTLVPYTLKEAALLIESGSYKNMDKIIVVVAPLELRVARVMHRDGATEAAVQARIAQQLSDAERQKYADFTIYNNGAQSLVEQVVAIHRALLY